MFYSKRATREQLRKFLQEKDLEISNLKERATKKINDLQEQVSGLNGKIHKYEVRNRRAEETLNNSISKEFCLQLVRAACGKNEQTN